MKHLVVVAALLAVSTHCAAAATPHQQRMWRVVLDSNLLLHSGWDGSVTVPEIPRARVKAARLRFGRMPRRRLGHTLHATLAALPPRSAARQSVSYIAAVHGFNVDVNVDRVMNTGTEEPPQIWGHEDVRGLAEDRYERVYEIYLRHPSRRMLNRLLHEQSDGAGAEMLSWILAELLRRNPGAMMDQVAADPRALQRLRDSLQSEGGAEHKLALARFRQNHSKAIRRAAWLCLRTMSDTDIWRRQHR